MLHLTLFVHIDSSAIQKHSLKRYVRIKILYSTIVEHIADIYRNRSRSCRGVLSDCSCMRFFGWHPTALLMQSTAK